MKTPKKTTLLLFFLLFTIVGWWILSSYQPSAHTISVAENETVKPQKPMTQIVAEKANELPKIVQPYAHTPMLNLVDPRWKDYEVK